MIIRQTRTERGAQLKTWKRKQAERTREQLHAALDRFESGKVVHVPKSQGVTRAALAKEASVAEDTAFSRYRSGHVQTGQYRFPDIVKRFELLRKKSSRQDVRHSLKKEIIGLKATVKNLEAMLKASRRVVNAQDIKIVDLEMRNCELEKLASEATEERD